MQSVIQSHTLQSVMFTCIIGCLISGTFPISVLPNNTPVICSYPSKCGSLSLTCFSDNPMDNLVEWVNPNSEVISTNDNARIYG